MEKCLKLGEWKNQKIDNNLFFVAGLFFHSVRSTFKRLTKGNQLSFANELLNSLDTHNCSCSNGYVVF